MAAYLYTWNPDKWDWEDLNYAISRIAAREPFDIYWSCGITKRIEIGDIFFLMRLGVEPKGIIGCGYVSSTPYPLAHWDETKEKEGKNALRTDVLFKALSDNPIIPLHYLLNTYPSVKWTPQNGGISIPDEVASDIVKYINDIQEFSFEECNKEEIKKYSEGKPKIITTKTYDRNLAARRDCIEHSLLNPY